MLPKVNKAKMRGTMDMIEEYLRSCHGVILAPFAYITRMTLIVQTHGDYPNHATHDDDLIATIRSSS